jgi:hypothetical protein
MRARFVLFVLVLAPSVARATAQSVSVLGVSGEGGSRFAQQLEQELGELYEIIPGDVYRSAAETMGRRGPSPDEVRAVATSLRIDAIVAGTIRGEGAERSLIMVVREGASGRVVARGHYDLATHTLPLLRDKVLRDLVRVFEHIRHIPKHGQPLVEQEPESETLEEEPGETLPTERPAPTPPKARSHRGLYVSAGPALMSRGLSFDVAAAPGYHGGAVAGIRADGLAFPLALSAELARAHPVLASFGLAGSYERAYSLVSSTPTGQTAGDASRWDVMFVGRAPLGRGGALLIETGYQQLRWVSKSPTDLGVPDVGYGLFDFGLTWQHDLATPIAGISLRRAALGIVDPGAISDPIQYGPMSGGGLEADLGLLFRPTGWLWLRAGVRYTPLFLRFAAAGARFAHSALDQFVDATAEVGLAL